MNSSFFYSARKDLIEQTVGSETLLYDEVRHRAYCLNEISALVWRYADGTRTAVRIAHAATIELKRPVSEEIVLFALGELQRDGLLGLLDADVSCSGRSRRDLIKKIGIGAAVMMPMVTAVFAPKAAQAYVFATPKRNSRPSDPVGGESGSSSERE